MNAFCLYGAVCTFFMLCIQKETVKKNLCHRHNGITTRNELSSDVFISPVLTIIKKVVPYSIFNHFIIALLFVCSFYCAADNTTFHDNTDTGLLPADTVSRTDLPHEKTSICAFCNDTQCCGSPCSKRCHILWID